MSRLRLRHLRIWFRLSITLFGVDDALWDALVVEAVDLGLVLVSQYLVVNAVQTFSRAN